MFELAYWHKALQSPEILTGFLIDLLPLIAVIALGWGAGELVMLYWLENLLIGLITLMRIVLTGTGKRTISGGFHALFFGSFFTVHYGGFCMAHGVFLVSFFGAQGQLLAGSFSELGDDLVISAFQSFGLVGLGLILGSKFIWEFILNVIRFVSSGEYLKADIGSEMFAPYGRIVVLHLGIFGGAFAMERLGDPMLGVLALILFRAAVGVVTNYFPVKKQNA